MKKSMKKANITLAEAQRYVAYVASYKPKPIPAVEPVNAEIKPKGKGFKIENAEIKKLNKGCFFIVVTYGGKRQYEIQKRFKSTTKAQEWIYKHKYLTL